jgi:DNA-binding transcriptional MerR regulator
VTAETGDSAHLSIGEVLANLRDEFPDVTISKIRFLESQGLIDPERTPSGYRKFYGDDLERLRWILYQQREHFLPLRVIKERLDRFGPTGAPAADGNGDMPAPEPEPPVHPVVRRQPTRPPSVDTPMLPLDEPEADDAPDEELGDVPRDDSEPIQEITRADLLRDAGISDGQLAALESFALVVPIAGDGDQALYDEEALTVARLAVGFSSRGIEARHLKMYKHAADREAGLFAQVLMPIMKQRNPEARERSQQELEHLARLGRQLRTAMLRASLRESLTE